MIWWGGAYAPRSYMDSIRLIHTKDNVTERMHTSRFAPFLVVVYGKLPRATKNKLEITLLISLNLFCVIKSVFIRCAECEFSCVRQHCYRGWASAMQTWVYRMHAVLYYYNGFRASLTPQVGNFMRKDDLFVLINIYVEKMEWRRVELCSWNLKPLRWNISGVYSLNGRRWNVTNDSWLTVDSVKPFETALNNWCSAF